MWSFSPPNWGLDCYSDFAVQFLPIEHLLFKKEFAKAAESIQGILITALRFYQKLLLVRELGSDLKFLLPIWQLDPREPLGESQ